MSEQQPTPATEAQYRAGVAACLAMMNEDARERTRAQLNDPEIQKAIKWKSKYEPNKTDAQIAKEAIARNKKGL